MPFSSQSHVLTQVNSQNTHSSNIQEKGSIINLLNSSQMQNEELKEWYLCKDACVARLIEDNQRQAQVSVDARLVNYPPFTWHI